MTATTHSPGADRPDRSRPRLSIVQTRSGSRYRIDGATVVKLTGDEPGAAFELVDIRANRLRYTDGKQLFISSPLVAA